MDFNWGEFIICLRSGLGYLDVTVKLTLISLLIGLVLGFLIATARHYKIPVLSGFLKYFVEIYQGIPFMVSLLFYNIFFILCFDDISDALNLSIRAKDVDRVFIGYFALALLATIAISETLRGAYMAVDKVQFEAGASVGLTESQVLRRIVIPQMIPAAIPGLINNAVAIIKGTSLVTAIGLVEVLNGSVIPCSKTYRYMEGYIAAAAIYWVFTLLIEYAGHLLERHTKTFRKGRSTT